MESIFDRLQADVRVKLDSNNRITGYMALRPEIAMYFYHLHRNPLDMDYDQALREFDLTFETVEE